MTWSKFDDGFDEHERVQDAWFAFPPNPVGLYVMATTACNRWLSDGVIRPRWIRWALPETRKRAQMLAAMVDAGLFDVIPKGETRTFNDLAKNEIGVGPFEEDRYVVHDFLDRHDSSVTVKDRRRRDAERKAKSRADAGPPDGAWNPEGFQEESSGSPPGHGAESAGSPSPPHGRAPASRPDQPLPDPSLLSPQTPPAVGPAGPEGDSLEGRTTRAQAMALAACPACHQAPGRPCVDPVGSPRHACHSERHTAALANGAGAFTGAGSRQDGTSLRAEGTNPRAMKPGEPGWAKEHFPSAPPSAVKFVVGQFQQRSKSEPTPEAVRSYAERNPMYASQLGLTDGQAA